MWRCDTSSRHHGNMDNNVYCQTQFVVNYETAVHLMFAILDYCNDFSLGIGWMWVVWADRLTGICIFHYYTSLHPAAPLPAVSPENVAAMKMIRSACILIFSRLIVIWFSGDNLLLLSTGNLSTFPGKFNISETWKQEYEYNLAFLCYIVIWVSDDNLLLFYWKFDNFSGRI